MITINSVWFSGDDICVKMSDGKIVQTPIGSYPNLSKGNTDQLNKYEIKGGGRWIHWEELDEDLSVEGFLQLH
ncbi:MAG TPA: DUF2442 domain-containing protein [Mucilaginibacter sp.]|jgi:Protein of unknown function (DUF3532).